LPIAIIGTSFNCGDIVLSDEPHFWLDEKPDFVTVKPLLPQNLND